jgi:hypothetical protein
VPARPVVRVRAAVRHLHAHPVRVPRRLGLTIVL